jgi:DNA (cytosine-5)-methyltransferase 1
MSAYLSVCSGIEAATVAWHGLGWRPWAFSEIEAFPSAVLRHHYQTVPNLGDMTRFREWPDAVVDVLVGGTPCQSFSVAGLRQGLADPRGNLALTYLAIADRYRPRWLVWENVPGVLSADGGRAFGSLLGGLAILGYGFAYRVLDAQYFGLAQRRKRVFVVGHLGDWRRAAAVLFERESLSGHPAPCREAGERIAAVATIGSYGGGLGEPSHVAPTLQSCGGEDERGVRNALIAHTLNAKGGSGRIGAESETFIAHSLRADGFDASEDGTGRGTPLIAFSAKDCGADAGDLAPTLRAGGHDKSHANAGVMPAIAFANTAGDTDLGYREEQAPPLTGRHGDPGNVLRPGMQVRRLTPRECERLQGFPDDYTLIPYRGKLAADGPRYKALGNSMAVPVMAWIGRRMALMDALDLEAVS